MIDRSKALIVSANDFPDGIMWRLHFLGTKMQCEGMYDEAKIVDEAAAFIRELSEELGGEQ